MDRRLLFLSAALSGVWGCGPNDWEPRCFDSTCAEEPPASMQERGACAEELEEAARASYRSVAGAPGLSGLRRHTTARASIVAVDPDRVRLELEGGGAATFVWPEPLPPGLAVGDDVEIAASGEVDRLLGRIELAISRSGWVANRNPIELLPGQEVSWVTVCSEPIEREACPGRRMEILGLQLADGRVITAGRADTVDGATVGVFGGLELEGCETEDLVVESRFDGFAAAWRRANGRGGAPAAPADVGDASPSQKERR